MSDRHIDITGLQVVASVLATVTGTVAASYLGVAGTIIGAAVMSVASTAGSAVYKHYLGRTAGRLKELKEAAPVVAHKAAERMAPSGTHTIPHRHHHSHAGEGVPPPVSQPPAHSRVQRADGMPRRDQRADGMPRWDRRWPLSLLSLLGWPPGRRRWLLGGIAAIGLFAGVVGGITVFEAAAGKPLNAVVWHRGGSGTTVGGIVESRPSHPGGRPSRTAKPPGTASPTPSSGSASSPAPSPAPSSGSPSPAPSGSPFPTPGSSSPAATSPAPLASPHSPSP